jgi:hypothetical protein
VAGQAGDQTVGEGGELGVGGGEEGGGVVQYVVDAEGQGRGVVGEWARGRRGWAHLGQWAEGQVEQEVDELERCRAEG